MRESLMSEEYFRKHIEFRNAAISKREDNLKKDPDQYQKLKTVYYSLFLYGYELLIAKYSSGEDILNLKSDLEYVISVYEKYISEPDHNPADFETELEDYEISLWLISIALMLGAETEKIIRLLKCIGNEGKDALFEKLVRTRISGRKHTDYLLYPRIYQSLFDATIASKEKQPELVKTFLSRWYNHMKPCYWYDNHKGKDGGGFFGYWCWEAGAVTRLFRIDDSSYRNMQYYPKDMVDFDHTD